MTSKERFVINITLKKYGLTSDEIKNLIEKFEEKHKKYTTVVLTIERIVNYFLDKKHYEQESLHQLLKDYRMYNYSQKKIEKIEKVFLNNGYTEKEMESIVVRMCNVFNYNPESLGKKLSFYNEINLKDAIINNPQNLTQGLKLSYARYKFLDSKNQYNNNKQAIFLKNNQFFLIYDINQTELLEEYPLPTEYVTNLPDKGASLNPKEQFVLTITLQKFGISKKDINRIIEQIDVRRTTYHLIMNSIPELQKYFMGERKFDQQSFGKILRNGRIFHQSIEKIKEIEQVLKDNGYSDEEIKTIETVNPVIICDATDTLDQKLSFYNQIKVKNLIINNPRHLWQSVKLTHARHEFLKAQDCYDDHQEDLFVPEVKFIDNYNVDNKTLIKKYPCVLKKK